jgi:hypothetical protein
MQRKSTSSSQFSQAGRHGFSKQSDRILQLLRRAHGSWVTLPEILALGSARYGARIWELRRAGFQIQNRIEHVNGVCRSSYRLLDSTNSKAAEILKSTETAAERRDHELTRLPLFDLAVRP